jgi:hypothetical protein
VSASLSSAHVRAQVAALHEKRPEADVIGIHVTGRWSGPDRLRVGTEDVAVAYCGSALEVRERLNDRPPEGPPLVVLTPLEDADLGLDVLARLAKRRLLRLDPWAVVRELFRAPALDPRFARYPWMADILVAAAPVGGFAPAASGLLTLETAWEVILQAVVNLRAGRPDVAALLAWSTDSQNLARYAAAPATVRAALSDWVTEAAGAVGSALWRCVEIGRGTDALPAGLLCSVLFDTAAQSDLELARAAVRLEQHIGQASLDPAVARRWATAAEELVVATIRTAGLSAVGPWLQRADELMASVGAVAHAHVSSVLPAGLRQRLAAYASALCESAGNERLDGSEGALCAAASAHQHVLLRSDPERGERLDMSVRLLRWLRTAQTTPASFAAAAADYATVGALVDWARTALRGGDPLPELSAAYQALLARVTARREAENRQFVQLLRGWTETEGDGDVLPIEEVLGRVVVPLAAASPVLLLVLDGQSCAVFQELAADLVRRGWLPIRPAVAGVAAVPSVAPVIAAFPTVTERCRASLLCGALTDGGQPVEAAGFAQHPGLLAQSRGQFPPRLFHKGALTDASETDLADAVRDTVASPDTRVVGVVLNAVDDYLLKSDQVRARWTVDYVALLEPLLFAAQTCGRTVVITSDHGHVLEADTELRRAGQSDRWRAEDGRVADDEIVLVGRRVWSHTGGRIVVPWSERLRYGGKKSGYHGGASPQEVVVPLGVFIPATAEVEGWEPGMLVYPDWWTDEAVAPRPVAVTPPTAGPLRAGQGELFPPRPVTRPPAPAPAGWIEALFGSEVFAAQKAAAGRVPLADDRIRTLLTTLHERGGTLTLTALGQKLGLELVRLRGTISAMRRLLNVDGYEVLGVDEGSGSVVLNLDLLKTQFGLEDK